MKITIPLEWKQSDIEMVAKARAWAVKAHAGQKDKAGKDYFKAHVTVVAEGVKGDPIAEAVAFLHDTVEGLFDSTILGQRSLSCASEVRFLKAVFP